MVLGAPRVQTNSHFSISTKPNAQEISHGTSFMVKSSALNGSFLRLMFVFNERTNRIEPMFILKIELQYVIVLELVQQMRWGCPWLDSDGELLRILVCDTKYATCLTVSDLGHVRHVRHVSQKARAAQVVPKNPARFNPPGLVAFLSGLAQGTEVFRMAEERSTDCHGMSWLWEKDFNMFEF